MQTTVKELPEMHDPELIVIRSIMERHAAQQPSAVAISFEDGTSWTYQQALEQGYRAAQRLRAAGIGSGDRVAILLPNGADFLRAWWGTSFLGATMAPISPSWKGDMLAHALSLSRAALLVTTPAFEEAVAASGSAANVLAAGDLATGLASPPELERDLQIWDTHHLQFTSGTTGPSKAAVASYYQFHMTGSWVGDGLGWTSDDIVQCDLPLFHAGSLAVAASCLARGGVLAVRTAPSMTRYWQVARETGATFGFLVSSMAAFLLAQPESPADRDHAMRAMMAAPLPEDVDAFRRRFGIERIITAYGSSESSAPIIQVPGERPLTAGSCGRVRPPFEARLVDDFDIEVAEGQPGELILRSDDPWCITTGYFGDDSATARVWRNGWFHTGDQLRRDSDGNYFFVDRLTDSLRRRGENISSFEVERAVAAFPGVAEVACVAAPPDSHLGVDNEVKVWVAPESAAEIDFQAMAEFLVSRLPHHMVPRFYETIEQLPKTPSMRVQKFHLRSLGNSDATWDLEANGFQVTRAGLRPRNTPVGHPRG
ncbi:MAG TPA: AMP-binding protein [Mycobacterium sp.]